LGVANVEEIAEREHEGVGLSYDECLTYLRDHLYFYLGERELEGLELFRQQAVNLGLLCGERALQIAGTKPASGSPPNCVNYVETGTRFGPGCET
jgi:hypothetical protein